MLHVFKIAMIRTRIRIDNFCTNIVIVHVNVLVRVFSSAAHYTLTTSELGTATTCGSISYGQMRHNFTNTIAIQSTFWLVHTKTMWPSILIDCVCECVHIDLASFLIISSENHKTRPRIYINELHCCSGSSSTSRAAVIYHFYCYYYYIIFTIFSSVWP